jgi:hypothetical protein
MEPRPDDRDQHDGNRPMIPAYSFVLDATNSSAT